ncbi:hypothetical protein MZO42_08720 [Sphingomonas psychrotolerans]|uniref:DUF3617 family protein n=1 Tax=Sphingomonas psychrotolerans TaxID=1327635 RepID=A0ABU3N618_9SPHN|nr:DUF3617 family protein [Sphingomonas psychrotolerans]MDT8758780.1 hypothetical protein [Sphingomonas psychrotolerans]
MHSINTGLIGLSLLLAGCGASSDRQPVNGQQEAAADTTGVAVRALPKLRPGLWRTKMIEGDVADDGSEDRCVGPKDTDLLGSLAGGKDSQCSKRQIHRLGDGYAFDIACTSEYADATVKGNFRGDFANHVTGELTLGLAPPGQKLETRRYRYESRYVGTCTPDEDS